MPYYPEVLNAQETAIFLGVHVETVRRLARCGDLPSFKVGKDWRFRKEALLRWSEEQHRARAGGCSVLVVDDEENVCRATGRLLARLGCRVQYATGGQEGLDCVAHAVPDVIVLDLTLPDMNAPQFLVELRKTHPMLPVVIATDHPDSELMKRAAQQAPVMLLAKPVDAALLERTVRTALGAKAAPVSHEQQGRAS